MPRVAARRISARTSHLNGPNFLGVNVLLVIRDAVFWDVSRDLLRFRQRANPLVIVALLRGQVFFFFFFRNISCVLSRERHSSRKSPVAHLIVRMSSPRNQRLLWPAPAKETMASRCSCRSLEGPGALFGDSLTWSSEAIPVLLRPCSLIARQCRLHCRRFGPRRHTPHWWDEFQRLNSAE